MSEQPVALPEWIATFVGRLVLENEALRRTLAEAQAPVNGQVPVEEPAAP